MTRLLLRRALLCAATAVAFAGAAPVARANVPAAPLNSFAPCRASGKPVSTLAAARMSRVIAWIRDTVYRPDTGALTQSVPASGGTSLIVPWWGDGAAIGLLAAGGALQGTASPQPQACQIAGRWLDWALLHVDQPGDTINPHEVGGVLKWRVIGTRELAKARTSTDNGAAATLTLAWVYVRATGDTRFLTGPSGAMRQQRLAQIATFLRSLLVKLPDGSGLTTTTPYGRARDTSDNMSVWAGFTSYAKLLAGLAATERAGGATAAATALDQQASAARATAATIEHAIEGHLWSGANGYRWAYGAKDGFRRLYPESAAQVFGFAWGYDGDGGFLPQLSTTRRAALFSAFLHQPGSRGWARLLSTTTRAPHLEAALAATHTGASQDRAIALDAVAHVETCLPPIGTPAPAAFLSAGGSDCAATGRRAPAWNTGDAGWYLRTLAALGASQLSTAAAGPALSRRVDGHRLYAVRYATTVTAPARYAISVIAPASIGTLRVAVAGVRDGTRTLHGVQGSLDQPRARRVGTFRVGTTAVSVTIRARRSQLRRLGASPVAVVRVG